MDGLTGCPSMAPFQQLCQVGEASECTGLSKFPCVPSPASLQDFLPQFLQPWGWSYSGAPGKGSCEVACLAFSLKELTRNSGDFNIPETIRLCYATDQKKPAFLKQDQSSQLINSFLFTVLGLGQCRKLQEAREDGYSSCIHGCQLPAPAPGTLRLLWLLPASPGLGSCPASLLLCRHCAHSSARGHIRDRQKQNISAVAVSKNEIAEKPSGTDQMEKVSLPSDAF